MQIVTKQNIFVEWEVGENMKKYYNVENKGVDL